MKLKLVRDTYRIQKAHCGWRNNMQWRINIFIILSHIKHNAFVQWWCHPLALNNGLTKIVDGILYQRLFKDVIFLFRTEMRKANRTHIRSVKINRSKFREKKKTKRKKQMKEEEKLKKNKKIERERKFDCEFRFLLTSALLAGNDCGI